MRHLISAVGLILLCVACSSKSDNFVVSGTVKGLQKGTLLLQKLDDTLLVTVDSVMIEGNSNFRFENHIDNPEIYYLYVRLKNGSLMDDRISFFAEEGEMTINTNLEKFGSSARISGSKNDSLLRQYDKLKQRYVAQNLDLVEERLKLKAGKDDSLISVIKEKQHKLLSNKYLGTINFAMNHKEYEVAPYLILSEAYNANIKYLDTVYNTLEPKIKDSKYGKELESFIKNRKENDTL